MLVRDAIHGDIEFSPAEERLINSKPFFRMKNIKQLGFVDSIYPCATHTRYQHSLGVAKCITDMYNAICKNNPSFYRDGDVELLRLMALVHDLGHAPFSHASEELSTIEHEERLTEILKSIKNDIILPFDYDIPAWQLVNEVYQGIGLTYLGDSHLIALHSLLDGFIDADKLDYLQRDAYFCGVQYGKFDRDDLINNLTIVDGNIAILPDGINALESFVLARYYMFNKVYYHPEERIMRKMYCEEMKTLLKEGVYPEDTKKFLALDDSKYIGKLKFIKNNPFKLLYDGNFNLEFKQYMERFLGKYLVCDSPHKSLFRTDEDSQVIYVKDEKINSVYPCTDASTLLKSIEYSSIHRLRYYVNVDVYEEVKAEFQRLVKVFETSIRRK